MNTKHFLLTGILLIAALSPMHAQHFSWAKNMGGWDVDLGNSISVDTAGNVYTTGRYADAAYFDPSSGVHNLTSVYNEELWWYLSDAFISKLDHSGNHGYSKSVGGKLIEEGVAIAATKAGAVYIAGTYADTADFDPGSGVYNLVSFIPGSTLAYTNSFIMKLDAAGNFLWAKRLGGGAGGCTIKSMVIDEAGNVYSTGDIDGTHDFDPGPGTHLLTPPGYYSAFISKLDSSGNFVWAQRINGETQGSNISLDTKGNVLVTGNFWGTTDFDPGANAASLTSLGGADAYILKLDNAGNFLWARQMGGKQTDNGMTIAADLAGNVYTGGIFSDTVDFDPGANMDRHISAGGTDIFVSKWDSSGNFKWARSFGGRLGDAVIGMAVDHFGGVFTTGYFQDTVDFDPGTGISKVISLDREDAFLAKMDSAGNYLWAQQFGGSSTQMGRSVTVDNKGGIYFTGYFNNTVDFDPGTGSFNLISDGGADVFVCKLTYCVPTFHTLGVAACDSFSFNNVTYLQSGTYNHILVNAAGCDSVVTLNLTIGSVDTSVIQNSNTLTANEAGVTYQWVNCDNGYSPVSGANSQSFTPQTSGSFAVIITQNGCTDTSVCFHVDPASVQKLSDLPMASVYPNPASHTITVITQQALSDATIRLMDINGRTITRQLHANGSVFRFNVTDYPAGVYFIVISTKEHSLKNMFIKD